MEATCAMPKCNNRASFKCQCKAIPVLICDTHFSNHVKSQGEHKYDFIPSPVVQTKPPPCTVRPKNLEVQRLLDTLPASTRLALSKLSPTSTPTNGCFIKPPVEFVPKYEIEKIFYSETEYYDGEIENNKEHGTGKYIGLCEYEGDWRYGLPHGTGQLVFSNGKYHGSWREGMITGNGMLELANGEKYIGEFNEGKFEGNGKYCFADGREVFGYFRDHFLITPDFFSSIPIKYFEKLQGFNSSEANIPQRFEVICEIFSTKLLQVVDRDSSANAIRFFKNNSFMLVKVDYEQCEITEEIVTCSHKISGMGGICEIQDVIMHVGGLLGEKPTGNSMLFHPFTSEITWLEPCSKRSSPCAVSCLNNIYVFGGSDHFLSFLTHSEMYNCTSHKWSRIASLPGPSDAICAGTIGPLISLSGYLHTKAYIYNALENNYSTVLELPDFREKVYCVANAKCFLLCNWKLYESKTGNPFELKFTRDIVYHGGWVLGYPVKKGNLFYWYTSDKELWKFDTDTKAVFLIKTFK